jgi:hypothetical protein
VFSNRINNSNPDARLPADRQWQTSRQGNTCGTLLVHLVSVRVDFKQMNSAVPKSTGRQEQLGPEWEGVRLPADEVDQHQAPQTASAVSVRKHEELTKSIHIHNLASSTEEHLLGGYTVLLWARRSKWSCIYARPLQTRQIGNWYTSIDPHTFR